MPNVYDHMDVISKASMARERLDSAIERLSIGDYLAALRHADDFAAIFSDVLADVAQHAYDAGATKKQIADALGVTPATFRGMQKSAA